MVMDHGRTGPQGALGGADGGVNRVRIVQGSRPYVPEHLSKDQGIQIEAGDLIEVSTPGGGGYGNPFERDPELVARDVARGYYTRSQAKELFGVVIGTDGVIDAARTAGLRDGARAGG